MADFVARYEDEDRALALLNDLFERGQSFSAQRAYAVLHVLRNSAAVKKAPKSFRYELMYQEAVRAATAFPTASTPDPPAAFVAPASIDSLAAVLVEQLSGYMRRADHRDAQRRIAAFLRRQLPRMAEQLEIQSQANPIEFPDHGRAMSAALHLFEDGVRVQVF